MRLAATLVALLVAINLPACAVLSPDRSFGRELDDTNASWSIKSAMTRASDHWLAGVDVEVRDGVVLLAGTVPREVDRQLAECLSWQPASVRMVANEIEIARAPTTRDYLRNGWITQQINTRFLGDGEVRSANINVDTHNGVVYLTGLARSEEERERAAAHAAAVEGVERVVVFLRLTSEAPEFADRAEGRARACEGQSEELLHGLS